MGSRTSFIAEMLTFEPAMTLEHQGTQACGNRDKCVFCQAVYNHKKWTCSVKEAENLLTQLEIDWAERWGDYVPPGVHEAVAGLALVLSQKKELRKALSQHGMVRVSYQKLLNLQSLEKINSFYIEIMTQHVQDDRYS